ncbi:MAG: prepilin-type N-terminal cleavage/methylation domain-containing protein [Thermaceae bacterium]|nr:prepilin-type N-terminal cleavage/methylation domain-containing protein [Thermaceae bacterium]
MKTPGFTLIELLIVIAIIVILAAALVPNLIQARNAANDQATRVYIRSVVIGVETRRDLATLVIPPSMTCNALADKPSDPGSVSRCKYEPDNTNGTYKVTAESKSGKIFQYTGDNTVLVATY